MADDESEHGFLYVGTPGEGGQMIDLDAWLDVNNPAEGAKWTLERPLDISNTGWVTGQATYLGVGTRAFLLDASSLVVPEPGGLALLFLASPVLLRRRAQRTKKSGR
jgi:hypothetical protein